MPSYTIRSLFALLLCLVVAVPAAAQSTAPTGPMWTESPKAQIPADIARLNNHMNSVIEQLKPVLVQIRVRRAQEPPVEGETRDRSARSWRGSRECPEDGKAARGGCAGAPSSGTTARGCGVLDTPVWLF